LYVRRPRSPHSPPLFPTAWTIGHATRQEAKDRIRSQHDYQVNPRAELEIRHLHEKVDHLLSHQWERLVQIQELQLELLSDPGARK
jgi:hypothetical protein